MQIKISARSRQRKFIFGAAAELRGVALSVSLMITVQEKKDHIQGCPVNPFDCLEIEEAYHAAESGHMSQEN